MRHATVAAVFMISAALGLIVPTNPGEARIRCDGEYQLNRSGPVITPYCEDEYLAQVARTRGLRVTGAEIRASFGVKRDVCRVLRFDTRVALNCGRVLPERLRRRGPIFIF